MEKPQQGDLHLWFLHAHEKMMLLGRNPFAPSQIMNVPLVAIRARKLCLLPLLICQWFEVTAFLDTANADTANARCLSYTSLLVLFRLLGVFQMMPTSDVLDGFHTVTLVDYNPETAKATLPASTPASIDLVSNQCWLTPGNDVISSG